MVRVLMALRATIAGHQWTRSSPGPLILAVVLGLLSALGTLTLGFVQHARPAAAGDILAAVFALWLGGQLAQAALAGGQSTLRPEFFALLPLPPRRLAWSLLIVGLADPVLILLLIAYAALVPVGWRDGPGATATAVVAAVLTTVMTGVLAVVAGGVLGPGARRGRDLGTIFTAVALSLLALTGTLLPTVINALDRGNARWLTVLVRTLPSGWGANAVDAARHGEPLAAAAWLAGLVLICVLTALTWPWILRRRMSHTPHTARGRSGARRGRVWLATPVGAVCVKELRLWARDPVRLTCLLIAAIVGVGVALIPRITADTGLLMPFAGPLTIVIAGACAGNLYGNDGTSLWLTVMAPDSASADVRGRQAAWLIVVAPFTVVETVLLASFSNRPDLWPWALALVIALLGGAAGLVPMASLVAIQPLDEAGNPTPGWSIKVHVALFAVLGTAAPAAVVLVAGAETGADGLSWAAVALAVSTALIFVVHGGRWAARRLATVQVDVLRQLLAAA